MIIGNNENPRVIASRTKFESDNFKREIRFRRHNWVPIFIVQLLLGLSRLTSSMQAK
jgi:ABC-type bacteriocin/lantibiotic exporter with double-glycine peptidase domain